MYSQDKEEELFEKLAQQMPEEAIFGNYNKPSCLTTLETLVKSYNLNLESIGFFLSISKTYFPAPIDIIPFAKTGGDGCYFAFMTDFGYYKDLEEAPILFVSPTDFDESKPHQANILFAANFRDFLSIMLKIRSAEIIRFNDVRKMDFEKEVKQMEDDSITFGDRLHSQRKLVTDVLTQNFKLREISNLNEYYQSLYKQREEGNFIKTIDGIGIKTKETPQLAGNSITEPVDINTLHSLLDKMTQDEKNKFYREAAYIYPHYKETFLLVLEIISSKMKEDNLLREAIIIDFEVTQSRYMIDYQKIREENIRSKGQ